MLRQRVVSNFGDGRSPYGDGHCGRGKYTRARENRLPCASREETGRDERRGEISRARVRISPAPDRSFDTARSLVALNRKQFFAVEHFDYNWEKPLINH